MSPRAIAAGLTLLAAFAAGWIICQWRATGQIEAIKRAGAEATTAALVAEKARTAAAIVAANDANRDLAAANAKAIEAQGARLRAEQELINAFNADPDMSNPGVPRRVLDNIKQHWRDQ